MDLDQRYRSHVALDSIRPSPTNPRKHFDEAALAELAESIKEHGLVTPILLTMASDGEALYEIVSGERRWRASKLAGETTIPAVIRDDLTPAAIAEIQLVENLQRADLHPLEEAEGYERMMKDHGHTADSLAEKIGKSRSYIFGRLKLLDLSEDSRRLFYGGLLNPSTALLVARIPSHKLQAKAVEEITKKDYQGDIYSVREAQRHIRSRYMLQLDKAPFPPDDGELIATAGPCGPCPKRTGNTPDLFDDVGDTNVCTDPDCYTAKKLAAAARRARELGPDVQVITGEEATKVMPEYAHESRTHVKLDTVCYDDPKHRTYREIIGDDKAAIAVVEQPSKGDLVEVVSKKAVAQKLKEAGVVTRKDEAKEDAKKLQAKVDLANHWRDKLFRTIRAKAATEIDDEGASEVLLAALPLIALRFLTEVGFNKGGKVAGLWGAIGSDNYSRFDAFKWGLPNLKPEQLLLFMLDLALIAEQQTDQFNYQNEPKLLKSAAAIFGVDPEALFAESKAELKAAEQAKKPKKTGKKAPPATSEDHSYPSEAAQAAGLERAETPGAANEAAQAGEQTAEEPKAEEQSSAAGAAVEKPSGAETRFAVGNLVRLKADQREGYIASGQANDWRVVFEGGSAYATDDEIEKFDEPFCTGARVKVCIPRSTMNGMVGECSEPITPNLSGYVFFQGIGKIMLRYADLVPATDDLEKAIETHEKPSSTSRPPIKYQHPDNAELQWTGRGRKPKWVEHWLTNHPDITLDDLKIEGVTA